MALDTDQLTCQNRTDPCLNFGCSDVCVVETNSAVCYCREGRKLQGDEKTCEQIAVTDNATFNDSLIDGQGTIHSRTFLADSHCWYKNFAGWEEGQAIVYSECNEHATQTKYQFNFNETTSQIELVGSVTTDFPNGLCVQGSNLDYRKRSLALTAACDSTNVEQKFQYEAKSGKLRSKSDTRMCIQIVEFDAQLRFDFCSVQDWGVGRL